MNVPNMNNVPTEPQWPVPEPLNPQPRVAPFPVQVLPGPLPDFLESVCGSVQVPADMVGPAMLGALATAVQGRYRLLRRNGGAEQVNLYTLVTGKPGTRKSPVEKLATGPLRELEQQLREESRDEVNYRKRERDLLEERVKNLKAKAKTGKAEAEEEYRQEAKKLDDYTVPALPRLITGEVTPERLPDIAAENGNAVAVIASEGGVLDTFLGRYSNGNPNLDMLTAGYSGDSITIDRKGREPVYTDGLAVTVLLFLQPSVLANLFGALGVGTQGLMERFLIAVPEEVTGKVETDTRVPQKVMNAYSQLLQDIGRHCRSMEERADLHLSPEAWEEFCKFSNRLYKVTEPGGAWDLDPFLKGWGSKLAGTTLRLAGLLHIANEIHHRGNVRPEVPLNAMRGGITLANFYTGHMKKALKVSEGATDQVLAERALNAIKRHKMTTANPTAVIRKSGLKGEEARKALAVLEEYGYLVEEEQEGRRGRSTTNYAVNPCVHEKQTPSDSTDLLINSRKPREQAERGGSVPSDKQVINSALITPPPQPEPEGERTPPQQALATQPADNEEPATELPEQGDMLALLRQEEGAGS